MNGTVLSATSPVSARYWSELKGLSDDVKLELITLLSSSMTRGEIDVKKEANEKFEAALRRFSGDFGGDGNVADIAREMRQEAEMKRDVETW